MKTKKLLFIMFLASFVFIMFLTNISLGEDSQEIIIRNAINSIDSPQLKNTIITPVLDTEIEKDKNMIYCATFQMAWNQLCKDVLKETAEIENAPKYIKTLNERITDPPMVSDDSHVSIAGLVEDKVVDRFNYAILEKFKDVDTKELPIIKNNIFPLKTILIFSYLNKNLAFNHEFNKTRPIKFKNDKNTSVKTFGIEYYDERNKTQETVVNQTDILYYFNADEFNRDFPTTREKIFKNNILPPSGLIMKFKTASEDEIVISSLPVRENFYQTLKNINFHINEKVSDFYISDSILGYIKSDVLRLFFHIKAMHDSDSLQIPIININLEYFYDDLKNKILSREGYFIGRAIQTTKFNLNEKGVKLSSTALEVLIMGEPRKFCFDKPFIIYLKKKSCEFPYFMAYIQNTDLLEKAE